MNDKLLLSKEIIEKAIIDYQPYAIVLMLSGGDDSMTALTVAKKLRVPLTHIMHGITGTGIQETTDFVRQTVERENLIYLEANAGDSYINYVMRKGFFGVGERAHTFSYHVLKVEHFRKAVSRNIRQHKRNRRVLFVNGGRKDESVNRQKTFKNPIKVDGNNIWVNIINDWTKQECLDFLSCEGIDRNPVSKQLCRSGECMCGTMQNKFARIEASLIYPKWGKWLDDLEKIVKSKFGWGWGENMPKKQEPPTQHSLFQPMCVGCIKTYNEFEENK